MPSGQYDRGKVDYGMGVCLCGKTFKKNNNVQKYCSYECPQQPHNRPVGFDGGKYKKGQKLCPRCRTYFPAEGTKKGRAYCPPCSDIREQEFVAQQEGRAHRPRHLLERTCVVCERTFNANRGHQRYCTTECKNVAKAASKRAQRNQSPQFVTCLTCGVEFQQKRVFQKYCTPQCWRAHPDQKRKVRNKAFWYEYGIDMDTFEAWFKLQGGKCEVCQAKLRRSKDSKTEAGRIFAIDHDHETGAVRGLICQGCNLALGATQDDEATLTRLIQYLRNAKSKSRQRMIKELQAGNPSYLESGEFPHLW